MGTAMGSLSDRYGSRAAADGASSLGCSRGYPSSLGCPMSHGCHSSDGCPQLPWGLQLWSRPRAGEACRGQPAPSWQALGGQSPAVSLNTPLCARQQDGRAWPSLGLETLAGWVVPGLWQASSRVGHLVGTPAASSPTQTATPWLARRWAGRKHHLGSCANAARASWWPAAPHIGGTQLLAPQWFPTVRQGGRGLPGVPI